MSDLDLNDITMWSRQIKYLGYKHRFTKVKDEFFKLLRDVIEIKGYQFDCHRGRVQYSMQFTDDIEIQEIYHSKNNRGKKCPLCKSTFFKAQANKCEKATFYKKEIETIARFGRMRCKDKLYKL